MRGGLKAQTRRLKKIKRFEKYDVKAATWKRVIFCSEDEDSFQENLNAIMCFRPYMELILCQLWNNVLPNPLYFGDKDSD